MDHPHPSPTQILHFHQGVGPRLRRLIRPWLGAIGSDWVNVLRGRTSALPGMVQEALAGLDLSGRPGRVAFDAARTCLADTRRAGAILVELEAPGYPGGLAATSDPPWLLWTHGDAGALHRRGVAIVGSRNASREGMAIATALGTGLARAGLCVVSGLARGIDAAAHRGAIAGAGSTIAVLGCGVDVLYPRENRALASDLRRVGALVSEFPPGTPPLPAHFPRRNRIIAGMTLATVVVEASLKSGSLITAGHALEAGREVFAVPGPVWSANSRGVHQLLRQGAGLIETLDDLLSALELPGVAVPVGVPGAGEGSPRRPQPAGDAARVLDAIGRQPVELVTLCEQCGLDPARLAMAVTELEVQGWVERRGGGFVRLGGQ